MISMSNELKTTEKLTKKDINNAALRYMFMACNTFNYENQQGLA
jgi:PTS system mannose-specific IID component